MSWRDAVSSESLIAIAYRSFAAGLTLDDVATLVQFLQLNQLTELDEDGGGRRTAARSSAGRHGVLMTLMHN